MEKNDKKKEAKELCSEIDNKLNNLASKRRELSETFESFKQNDCISKGDDRIISMIDDCYSILSSAAVTCDRYLMTGEGDALDAYRRLAKEREDFHR